MIKKKLKQFYEEYLYYRYKYLYEKDPRLAAICMYKKIYGKNSSLNIDNPHNLIEKIIWLELNTDISLWTLCADKYRVREYVEKCNLSNYMPILYGHWENPDEIDFETLPNEFVLKSNNGCGTVKVVRDKKSSNCEKIRKELKQWLKRPFGYMGAQKHYLSIKPCIIAEELLPNSDIQKNISPNSLIDYKIWCFKGKIESILVVYDRTSKQYCLDLYDIEWNRMEDKLNLNGHFEFRKNIMIPKPECLEQMLEIASKLSEPFPEVRVDFYIVNKKPIIGELTFSAGYGNLTMEYYDYLGKRCDISDLKTIKKIYELNA